LTFLSSFFLKNLAILISFDKFDRGYMQSWLLAVAAPGGEKTRQLERRPRTSPPAAIGPSSPRAIAWISHSTRRRLPSFNLFRLMSDQTFRDRHAGRRKTQRLALDQDSAELDAVQQSLDNQAAAGFASRFRAQVPARELPASTSTSRPSSSATAL
jgi:hypothetical protein